MRQFQTAKSWLGCLIMTVLISSSANSGEIKVHYHRPEKDYQDWTLWTWNTETNQSQDVSSQGSDEFGLIFSLSSDAYGKGLKNLGILPKFQDWKRKDEPDRRWDSSMGNEVFLVSGEKKLFTKKPDIRPRVWKGLIEAKEKILIVLSESVDPEKVTIASVRIKGKDGSLYEIQSVKPYQYRGSKVKIIEVVSKKPLDLQKMKGGSVEFSDYLSGPLRFGKVLDDLSFLTDKKMGAQYQIDHTFFRAFAPTADQVSLLLYDKAEGGEPSIQQMKPKEAGLWEIDIQGDLLHRYYKYRTWISDESYEVLDPYSRSNTSHHGRCLIENDKTSISPYPEFDPSKAVIYELHLRDFTIDPADGNKYPGKYLGLTQEGTTLAYDKKIKTTLDHLKELGVNTIQIMPFQDFDNDESSDQYNWGYMPFHFFSPDGWFATRQDDEIRVREVKKMVDVLHRNGFKVVMDVVYNHTAENLNYRVSFNGLVPNYYYRVREDGSYWNGSGTGNEFRSESPMGRKYILDSLKYWVEEYDIDGFRFDLMGLIDLETLKKGVEELRKIKPDILFYGEPWAGGETPIHKTEKGAQKGNGFSVFNDHFRDAMKGSTFGGDPGFLIDGRDVDKIKRGIMGSIDDFTQDPPETINYIAAHDNRTFWDRLKYTTHGHISDEDLIKADLLGASILLTSQGIPFLHSGMEMLRTKQGDENSYNKPDAINEIHWSWKKKNFKVFSFYEQLIRIRNAHPMFRMKTAKEVRKNLFFLDDDMGYTIPEKTVGYFLHQGNSKDKWVNAVVLFNPNAFSAQFPLPKGVWTPVLLGEKISAQTSIGNSISNRTIVVPPRGAAILYNTDETLYNRIAPGILEAKKPRIHRFIVSAPNAGKITVAGSFNGWNNSQYALKKQGDGSWMIEIPLRKGNYEYKFLQDGDWDKLNKDNRHLNIP